MQVNGHNYLIPTNAKLHNENDTEYDCVRADRVLAKMENAGTKTSIVILDACRDNPFERSWRKGTKGSGLAFMNAPSGSLIAYSTAPGKTALDGRDSNSPYTYALLQHIGTPDITVLEMFQGVRSTVMANTGGKQTPWESTSLRGNFYFASKGDERDRLARERRELEKLRAEIERKQSESQSQKTEVGNLAQNPSYFHPSSTTPMTFTNSLGMKFVKIPSGSFMMGSGISASEVVSQYGGNEKWYKNERPQHRVTISKPFYMQTMEVTVGQWRSFVQDSGYKTEAETGGGACVCIGKKWENKEEAYWDNPGFDQSNNNPVTCVSWNDAQAFIKWLNRKEGKLYRLPTKAEWEYAAKAGTKTPFYTGDCLSTKQANYNGNYPGKECSKGAYRKKTTPGGAFSPNPWGLYDMHGNVFEWCQDWYGEYSSGSVTDPTGPSSGSVRVNRGGSWARRAGVSRSAGRSGVDPGLGACDLGFRLARAQ